MWLLFSECCVITNRKINKINTGSLFSQLFYHSRSQFSTSISFGYIHLPITSHDIFTYFLLMSRYINTCTTDTERILNFRLIYLNYFIIFSLNVIIEALIM